jgi:hypothetical protein
MASDTVPYIEVFNEKNTKQRGKDYENGLYKA